jgi:uncharacterized protein YndB with AHSA1/START domain
VSDAVRTDRDVFLTRAFDAPRAVVWRFWTDPELLSAWFGPPGTTVPADSVRIELIEGGRWELTMLDDDSASAHPIRGRIRRLEVEEYLEIEMGADTGQGSVEGVVLRIRFHDHGDRTRVTLHQGPFPSATLVALTRDGWTAAFATLDSLLDKDDHR